MKSTYLATTALIAMLAGPALAQGTTGTTTGSTPASPAITTPTPGETTAPRPSASASTSSATMSSDHQRADKIIGMDLRNTQDQDLGKIKDLLVGADGKITQVVLSVGGFLGIGDKLVAVDWNQVQIDPARKIAVASMTKDQLQQAPAFKYPEDVRTGASDTTTGSTGMGTTGAGSTGSTLPDTTKKP